MSVDFTRYSRGTVWFYKAPKNSSVVKGVQAYDRPALIISNNHFNNYAKVVNVVFLTTKNKLSPVHIPITKTGYNNNSVSTEIQNSSILVEQIATVNIDCLHEYLFTLSEERMSRVDAAIRLQFGLATTETTEENKISTVVDDEVVTVNEQQQEESSTNTKEESTESLKVDSGDLNQRTRERYTKDDYEYIVNNYPNNWVSIKNKYNKNNKAEVAKLVYYIKKRFAK